MKNIIFLVLMSTFFLFACSNIGENDPIADNRLSELLGNKNFFKLRAELENVENKLSEDRLLYYKMYCAQAFGNGQQSNKYADILLNKYKNRMNDTIISKILSVKSDNYISSYQYRDAADVYDILLKQYHSVLNSAEIASYQNMQALFGTLAAVQPQRIHKQDNTEIAAYRNPFNHLMMPIRCGGIADEFIFDTGANLSTITDSCAKKMGLTIYQSDIKVGSATGNSIQTQLAVADSLYVGDILFENVIFLVAPAEQMSFPSVNYEIHGVIGFPVLHQMGEVQLQKDGKIIVPQEPKNKQLANLCMDGLTPIVQVLSGKDTLLFDFDTGAKTSGLSRRYYDNHKSEIEQKSERQTVQRGGAGGIVEVEKYPLQNFPYSIGTSSNVLPNISVMFSEQEVANCFDGTVGQDIILQFNKMILNFQYMYIDFE